MNRFSDLARVPGGAGFFQFAAQPNAGRRCSSDSSTYFRSGAALIRSSRASAILFVRQ